MRCSLAAISPASSLPALSSNQQFVNRTAPYLRRDVLIQLIKTSVVSFCLSFSETFLFSLLPSFPILSPYQHLILHHSALSCPSFFWIFTLPSCWCQCLSESHQDRCCSLQDREPGAKHGSMAGRAGASLARTHPSICPLQHSSHASYSNMSL